MKLQNYYVYMLMNERGTTLYIGVTNNLLRRIREHKTGAVKGFSYQYNVHKLIYYEVCDMAEQAIAREKQLKNWHRDWKLNLARQLNPDLHDLAEDFQ